MNKKNKKNNNNTFSNIVLSILKLVFGLHNYIYIFLKELLVDSFTHRVQWAPHGTNGGFPQGAALPGDHAPNTGHRS